MIGIDKFFPFMEPPCSLMHNIPSLVWMTLGGMQLTAGVLIWFPKFKKPVSGFFIIFMLVFTIVHLTEGTKDVGGAIFMAVLLGIIYWNPGFFRGKKSQTLSA